MNIKTFWTVFIKILGIWLVLDSINVIPQFFSAISVTDPNYTTQQFALTSILLILTIGIYVFILRLFVFKTDWLIDKLHLTKGFEEEKIDLNVQLTTVLTVTTILIGGLMLVDALPQLCMQIFSFFQQKFLFRESPNSGWIILYLVKSILGYLIMTNSKPIVKFISKQATTPSDNIG